jgi:hypothetical protein
VHPFWLSPEQKCPWLKLSIEGRPWPDFELHDGYVSSLERERRGTEKSRGSGHGAVDMAGCGALGGDGLGSSLLLNFLHGAATAASCVCYC